jgi:RNA polymerase sigma-70 factor (ECF subfamily)
MADNRFSNADESELIEASVKGNQAAFGEIMKRYRRMVAKTVKGMIGDTVFAEDIGQEVFVKLYYSLSGFRGEAKLSTYIQRIAVNLTLNEIKRKKRFLSTFTHSGDDDAKEVDVPGYDSEEATDAKETVEKALGKLDPRFRIIVVMRMLQGYSTKETAEILDLPLGTVLSRLARAQEQLKQIIEEL